MNINLINKPLGYVLNICTFSKLANPNWLDEDYNPRTHIAGLKISLIPNTERNPKNNA